MKLHYKIIYSNNFFYYSLIFIIRQIKKIKFFSESFIKVNFMNLKIQFIFKQRM